MSESNTPSSDVLGVDPDNPTGSTTEKDPSDWVTGDEPMTGAQRSYLDTLASEAGETIPADLTKAQASEHIERLQGATGRGQDQSGSGGPSSSSERGQVSEVGAFGDAEEPIVPSDATAGYPTSESGEPQEGTAGPNAAPVHDPPEPTNESAR